MLPAPHRMRRAADFTLAVRRGRRAGGPRLAVHLMLDPAAAGTPSPADLPRVGLVVGRSVGPAVTRTRVKRRLRAVAAARIAGLPPGSLMVLRANPAAADATSADLGADLDRALARLLSPSPVDQRREQPVPS